MDEAALREKVGQLMLEVHHKPNGRRAGRQSEASASANQGNERDSLEESLDHLRLAVKYLVFDLEATKRENSVLRELLGDG